MNTLVKVLVAAVIGNEVRYGYSQVATRRTKAEEARQYAILVGKPLLVAGGPAGIGYPLKALLRFLPPHELGDVCLDIDELSCPVVGTESQYVEADIRNIPFEDKHFGAALASHILEHMPTAVDGRRAYEELARVADKVFIAGPSRSSLWAHLTSPAFHPLWVWEDDDEVWFAERHKRW